MKTYKEMVREAHTILAQYAESLGIYRKPDLVSEKVKSTGIKYFGDISIVRGYTRVGESGLVAPWCGRFGCGFYVDETKSSFYSYRDYYLFIKPLSAFFIWAMPRSMAESVLNLARENGFLAVDMTRCCSDGFGHPLVVLPPHLTASSRDYLRNVRFMTPDEYNKQQTSHWRWYDPLECEPSPYDAVFSLIDKVFFDDIAFRASCPFLSSL